VGGKDGLVRVGGVGTGRIFQWAHLRPYPLLWRKARLTAFHDVNFARAREACEKYRRMLTDYAEAHPEAAESVRENVEELCCFETLDELLETVDAVDVCTHSRGRMAVALAALDKGVHCMAEKPMARTWIEADRAARAFAARPDVFFQLNDDNVFEPRYLALRDLLRQGVIGKVQSFWLIRGSRLDATTVLKSQASAVDNGGGCLMDYGSHGLAGALSVLGPRFRPTRVESAGIAVLFPHRVLEEEPAHIEVEDNARVKVLVEDAEAGNWATIFLEASWCGGHIGPHPEKPGSQSGGWLRIEGDEGVIESADRKSITVRRWDGGVTTLPLREYAGETMSVLTEIETFIDCVRAGTPPAVGVEFGADVIAICDAAYLSQVRGRAVGMDEFKDYCRDLVARHGDGEEAEEALLRELLSPYARSN